MGDHPYGSGLEEPRFEALRQAIRPLMGGRECLPVHVYETAIRLKRTGWYLTTEDPDDPGPESKAERAIRSLREAADALEAMPFRRVNMLGPYVNVEHLRHEADYIERTVESVRAALATAEKIQPMDPASYGRSIKDNPQA